MSDFRPARRRIEVSVGESVRIMRELQELSQNRLAELSGIRRRRSRPLRMAECAWESNGPRFWLAPSSAIRLCSCFRAGIRKHKQRPNHAMQRTSLFVTPLAAAQAARRTRAAADRRR